MLPIEHNISVEEREMLRHFPFRRSEVHNTVCTTGTSTSDSLAVDVFSFRSNACCASCFFLSDDAFAGEPHMSVGHCFSCDPVVCIEELFWGSFD